MDGMHRHPKHKIGQKPSCGPTLSDSRADVVIAHLIGFLAFALALEPWTRVRF